MLPDIRTLVLILILLHILQILVFYRFFVQNRYCRGIRSWFQWCIYSAAGYFVLFVREWFPASVFAPFAILTNVMFFISYLFLYKGLMDYLCLKINRWIIGALAAFFLVSTLVSMFALDDANLRSVFLYLSAAAIMVMCGCILIRNVPNGIKSSANFLAALFFFQSVFLVFRSVVALLLFPFVNDFQEGLLQTLLFVIPFVTGYLWSFGLIIMVNQRLLDEHDEIESHLELVFNMNPDAVLITTIPEGTICDMNDGFIGVTGYSREDLIGKTTLDLGLWVNPGDRARLYEVSNKDGFVRDFESVLRTKDGSLLNGIIATRVFNVKKSRYLVSNIHDITERKKMELALQRSEEKFRLLVENNYDIIYNIGDDGVFRYVSTVWTRLLGHEVSDVTGKSFKDFVHPEDCFAFRKFLESVIASGERKSGVEYRMHHKDGSWLWHTSSAVPTRDANGAICGYYGIDRDIDEHKKLQDKLLIQATTDGLTGIINRRYFIELAVNDIKRAIRLKEPLSIALVDIDHFKEINDTWGHSVGDLALVFFTNLFKDHIRDIDILSRFGGDEFVLLLPETTAVQSAVVLGRVLITLSKQPLIISPNQNIFLTISAGVTQLQDGFGTLDVFDSLLNRADQALYRSKENGRNQVNIA